MNSDSQSMLAAILQLSENDRLQLVAEILESLPGEGFALAPGDPEFLPELERRFQDMEGSIPWSELRVGI